MRNMKRNYSIINEQAKLIRENVDYLSQQQKVKTILITSAESGTGKSMVSAHLSVAYAQKGSRTLLIDADLRKPTQHHLFSQEISAGLSDCIRCDIPIRDCVQQVLLADCEFSILTSGDIIPNPNDLLVSSKISAVLQEVKQYYDVIIIDTPPVNVVSDTLILAKKVDGVLMVVHADKTNKQSAKNAVKKLELVNANVLGVVVNGTDTAENYYY